MVINSFKVSLAAVARSLGISEEAAQGIEVTEEDGFTPTVPILDGLIAFRSHSYVDPVKAERVFYLAAWNGTAGGFQVQEVSHPLTERERRDHGVAAGIVSRIPMGEFSNVWAIRDGAPRSFVWTCRIFIDEEPERLFPVYFGRTLKSAGPDWEALERKALGAFHIRDFLIEQGLIATRQARHVRQKLENAILRVGLISPVSIERDHVFEDQLRYAQLRRNGAAEPKPVCIRDPIETLSEDTVHGVLGRYFPELDPALKPSADKMKYTGTRQAPTHPPAPVVPPPPVASPPPPSSAETASTETASAEPAKPKPRIDLTRPAWKQSQRRPKKKKPAAAAVAPTQIPSARIAPAEAWRRRFAGAAPEPSEPGRINWATRFREISPPETGPTEEPEDTSKRSVFAEKFGR